jgi:hypothetical protein
MVYASDRTSDVPSLQGFQTRIVRPLTASEERRRIAAFGSIFLIVRFWPHGCHA